MQPRKTIVFAVLAAATLPAFALTPEELFTQLSPSIWFVYGVDTTERRLSQGSGVVIGPQRVITNCHVVRGASTVFLRKENVLYVAKVELRDPARDLCQLQVANLNAPAVALGTHKELKVGQKVYALGNPKGFEVTLSDGLVSALRGPDGKDPIIQTTAPISPGSSGGGLFNEQGRLIGVTTLQDRAGQNLNFAVPADWIGEMSGRTQLAEDKKKEKIAALQATGVAYNPASSALPAVGTTWKYRYVDHRFSNTQVFSFGVSAVDGWAVHETMAPEGATSSQIRKLVTGADEMRFAVYPLAAGRSLLEFNPYLLAREENLRKLTGIDGYPGDRSNPWKIAARSLGWSEVKVPAGAFRALQVELTGTRTQAINYGIGADKLQRFVYRIWYAPDVGRYVRIHHESWSPAGLNSSETIELQAAPGSN